jgi:O-antigen/teichoic acid export membrane protein
MSETATASSESTGRRLGLESAITFAGIVVNAGLAFVITWMIAHGLGAGATGSFFQLTSLFMIATCIIGLGADTGLVRSLSRHVAQNDHGAIRPLLRSALIPLVVIGMVATCTVVIAAPWISSALGWGSDAASTVRVLALVLLPAAATGVLLGGSRGLGGSAPTPWSRTS